MAVPPLTGSFPAESILMPQAPRPPKGVVARLQALEGLTCLVSDVLDEMGIAGALPASRLRPVLPGSRIVGPAITLRKARVNHVKELRSGGRRGDLEVHNRTQPGDVLVIEGLEEVSNMGGQSALTSQRQGGAGAVIWGGCRDLAELRRIGYPVWSTAVTPITGVGRIDGVEINGDVQLGAVTVHPGDIVIADDDGVCIIPRHLAEEVTQRVMLRAERDAAREAQIRAGSSLQAMAKTGAGGTRS